MSFSDSAESGIMKLLFQAVDYALWADDTVTTPETNVGVALHTTAGPGEAGAQTVNEAAYGSYARQDIARTAGGWAEAAGVVTPVANIDFPEATSGSETLSHFSCAQASSSVVLCHGTVTPNIVVTTGVTPRLTTATTITLT